MKTIVFFATPPFAIPALEKLAENYKVKALVTQPDKPKNRGQKPSSPHIKSVAAALGIPVFQPKEINNIAIDLQRISPDFIITYSFGRLLPNEILAIPRKKPLNVHFSLLPKYRGSSPLQTAIRNGDKTTGVSVIEMVEKLDAGRIYLQKRLEIHEHDTLEEVRLKASKVAVSLLLQTLENFDNIHPLPQNEKEVTYCHHLRKEDGKVSWNTHSSFEIYNRYRAFHEWPGIHTYYKGKALKIIACKPGNTETQVLWPPGMVVKTGDRIFVPCKQGCIEILALQPEGKTIMSTPAFLNGYREFVGSLLG